MTVFESLNSVNVNGHVEKKNGLSYLSWAWAWAELLKKFPDSTYTIYENKDGWFYHTDGKTCWVKTGVTVEGKEYIEMLPVMDFKNRSIPAESVTSFDVNKAIQRSLTKAVARHGLGLYIYAGEDLPEGEELTPEPVPQDAIQAAPVAPDRRDAVGLLMHTHDITTSVFNGLYKAYCKDVLKSENTVPMSKLTEEQFSDMIMTINDQLKKEAAS